MKNRIFIMIFSLLLAGVIVGCEDLDNSNNPEITNFWLNSSFVILMHEGNYQLTVQTRPIDLDTKGIIYKSSDESVATVDKTGLITAHSKGTAFITGELNQLKSECRVEVLPRVFKISSNNDLTIFAQNNIQENFKGTILIETASIKTLTILDNKIKNIDGDLIILSSTITNLDGLYNLEKISGSLWIECPITTFEGLNDLKRIEGGFNLNSRVDITFYNPQHPESIGYYVDRGDGFRTLPEHLHSFQGLNNLTHIGGNFVCVTFHNNRTFNHLSDFDGLNKLVTIGGDFSPPYRISSYKGFDNLQSIGGTFSSKGDYYVANFEGLEKLESIGNDFIVDKTDSFKGLEKLESIGNDFKIASVGSFEGLNNLQGIGGNIQCFGSMKSFEGFKKLSDFEGELIIDGGSYLESFKGLENITLLKSLRITASSSGKFGNFKSFDGLNNIRKIEGDFTVSGVENCFPELETLGGLEKLSEISGTLIIKGQPYSSNSKGCFVKLSSLEGLNNLKNVAGNIAINSLSKLSNLSALTRLENVQNLTIENCPELFDFTPFENILTDYNYVFYTNGNGYNPTRHQILNGQGKP